MVEIIQKQAAGSAGWLLCDGDYREREYSRCEEAAHSGQRCSLKHSTSALRSEWTAVGLELAKILLTKTT